MASDEDYMLMAAARRGYLEREEVDILEKWSKEGSTEAEDILEAFKYCSSVPSFFIILL